MFDSFKKKLPGSKETPPAATEAAPEPAEPFPQAAHLPTLETSVGKAAYDHTALVGHGITHYKDIRVDPRSMPRITFEAKPANSEYLMVKHGLLSEAMKCIRPYMDFVLSLRGISGKEDLKKLLAEVLVRFLSRYWDMPASKSNHHSYRWGLVLHSLEVACGEAEKATSWNPKTMYGTDDIRLNRDKGKVVCLHFLKGLFHDSHKIYQYGIVAHQNPMVEFDPYQFDGAILDFKMVYPAKLEELWKPTVIYPGRHSAGEFLMLMPEDMRHTIPGDIAWEILNALFDMAESEADRASAHNDAERQGLPTTLELLKRAANLYFTEDRATTKPELHVFRASPQWFAVNSSAFFAKVRPPQGTHSNQGARQLFSEFNLLSVKGTDVLKVEYLVRFKDGREKRENTQLAFIDADFLLEVCPDLDEWAAEIAFGKKDENLVGKFCPLFDNYMDELPEKSSSAKKNAAEKKDADKEAASVGESGKKAAASDTGHVSEKKTRKLSPDEKNTAEAASVVSTEPVKWHERFAILLRRFTPSDAAPDSGWLYLTHQSVFLRPAPFIKKITTMEASDLDAEIYGNLAKNGYLNSPHSGKIKVIVCGGGTMEVEEDLIMVTLPEGGHYDLMQKFYSPEAK